jgi:hypothetical protein
MNYEISEEDRQFIVLSLALTSLLRPGFNYAALEIAKKFGAEKMFADFKRYNCETVQPQASRLDLVTKLTWIAATDFEGFRARVPFRTAGELGAYDVQIVKRPHYCDRGDWMIYVVAEGLTSFDACDCFPRMFFGTEEAVKAQMELWASRRQDIRDAR